jgi:hypothetical protein
MQIKCARAVTWRTVASAWVMACAIAGCGGGGGDSGGSTTPPAATYTLGGTDSGVTASGLVLANAGTTLAVASGATTFSFGSVLSAGSSYAVTVQSSPTGLTCSVANGTGSAVAADVSNVAVTCSSQAFTLGGTISGLTTAGLVLANGTSTVTVAANATTFTLPTSVAMGASYAVTVATQPAGLTCTVANGTGTMPAANVTNVAVSCTSTTATTFNLGGTISGLTSSGLVLANGSGNTITVAANATTFTLPNKVASGATYAVTVQTQPSGLNCTVANGTGTMPAANVTNVAVTCTVNTYNLGGTISGLTTSGLVLANGSGNTVTVAANATSFTLPNKLAAGTAYAVTVQTQPSGLNCTITNASGTMPAANVTNVTVSCNTPVSAGWTWMGGSQTVDLSSTYGVQGTPTANTAPGGRYISMGWRDNAGALWEFGGQGVDINGTHGPMNDLWKYTLSTGQWTWVSGSQVNSAPGNYGTMGIAASGNIPPARWASNTWTDPAGIFWMSAGAISEDSSLTYHFANDLWKYQPSTGLWTWVAGSTGTGTPGTYGMQGVAAAGNVPGGRKSSATWIDASGNLWLFGGVGYDGSGNTQHMNDLWKFSPSTGLWTWVSGSSNGGATSNYGTQGTAAPSNVPGARQEASSWIDSSGNLWLFGGYGPNSASTYGDFNDLWKFSPSTGLWTWVGGSTGQYTAGTYGTQGVASASSFPGGRNATGTWVDAAGNFWLFGGYGRDNGTNSGGVGLNDLWKYNPTSGLWTWVAGPVTGGGSGVTGTKGTPSLSNVPGVRNSVVTWTDASGNLWLHSGQGVNNTGTFGLLNDLWKY